MGELNSKELFRNDEWIFTVSKKLILMNFLKQKAGAMDSSNKPEDKLPKLFKHFKFYDHYGQAVTDNFEPNPDFEENPLGMEDVEEWLDVRAEQKTRRNTSPPIVLIRNDDKQSTGVVVGPNCILTLNNEFLKISSLAIVAMNAFTTDPVETFEVKVEKVIILEKDPRLCLLITQVDQSDSIGAKTGWLGMFGVNSVEDADDALIGYSGEKTNVTMSGYPKEISPFPYIGKVVDKSNGTFKVEPAFKYTNNSYFNDKVRIGVNSKNIEKDILGELLKYDKIKVGDYVALDLKTGDIYARIKPYHIKKLQATLAYQDPGLRSEEQKNNTKLYFEAVEVSVSTPEIEIKEGPIYYHTGRSSEGNEGSPLFAFVASCSGQKVIALHSVPRFSEFKVIPEPEEGSIEPPKEKKMKKLIGGVAVRLTFDSVSEIVKIIRNQK